MTLDISRHRTVMLQILKDIASDAAVSPYVGFKGGTAAYLFYNLPRFSVDLDFDLLDETREDAVFENERRIVSKYGKLKDARKKRFNLFFLLSYEDAAHNIKVEINRRMFGSRFEVKTTLGISLLVMTREDMCANKLLAMQERVGKTSRDIFDVWFFLSNRWPINEKLIEERMNMSFRDFTEKCIEELEKKSNRDILAGVGELLTESQKDWARAQLKTETLFLLGVLLDSAKKNS